MSVFENMPKANIFSKYDGLFLERAEMYRIAAKKRWVQLPSMEYPQVTHRRGQRSYLQHLRTIGDLTFRS